MDSSFANVFAVDWLAGDQEDIFSEKYDVAISKNLARKYFSAQDNFDALIGRYLRIPGRDPLQIAAVFDEPRPNQTLKFDLLISYEFFREGNPYYANNWSGNYQGSTWVVLTDGQDPTEVEARVAGWKKKYLPPEDDQRISYYLQSLIEIHNETRYGSSIGSYTMPKRVLHLSVLAGLLVLFISVFNFVNLVTAESLMRLHEIGVRKVLGGHRRLLIRQFFVEYALQIVLATAFAMIIAYACLRPVNQFFAHIDLQLALQHADWIHIAGTSLLTILLAGIYPAIRITSLSQSNVLKPKSIFPPNQVLFRKGLVLIQFVLVQLFVIGAIVLNRQMQLFRSTDFGFSSEAVISIPTPDTAKLAAFRNDLMRETSISKVAFGSGPPMNVRGFALGTTYRLPGQAREMGQEAEMKIGDINYLDLYQLPLIEGRNFTENKRSFDEFIVNETLIKAMGWEAAEAIGKRIQINEGEAEIIGVVTDYHNNSLQDEISPCIILNWQYFLDHAFIQVADISDVDLNKIASIWEGHFSGSVFRYTFVDDDIAQEYHLETSIEAGLKILSLLVMIIACLGIFGLMMFTTQRRRKEVSIRKVLGASVISIVQLFSMEIIYVIIIAFCISAPLIFIMADSWLNNFAHRIVLTPRLFILGGAVTLVLALVSTSLQTIKAALVHPVTNLRE